MIELKKRLLGLPSREEAFQLIKTFELLFNTQCLGSAALTGGASATVTTGAAFTAVVNGALVAKASGASLAALNGPTIANAGLPCQVWLLTVDAAGSFYTYPGTPAATIAAVGLPSVNASNGNQAPVGLITMNNASAGSFIPAATLLNVANLGITYNNLQGPFFPVLPA
jgi:hypothetical protein